MTSAADQRMLLVHAHPDDETIGSGVTMAKYVAAGASVTLVTCTRGEEGEVLIADLVQLGSSHNDVLGKEREQELAAALEALGVRDHRFLGSPKEYRDSGMMGEPSNDNESCFWRSDLLEPATRIASTIREIRPHVLVTYDENGAYGHPDHIQAHRVAMYGLVLAAASSFRPDLGEAWDVSKVYWTALPTSYVQRGIDALIAAGGQGFFGLSSADDLPFVTPDELVTTRVDGRDFEAAKMKALRAHATQVDPDSEFFKMSELIGPDALGWEFFRLVRGALGPRDADGFEYDLFA